MSASPLRQFALQGAAVLLVLSLAWPYFGTQGEPLPWPETAYVIGAMAFALATLAKQPPWWRIIHAVFVPLLWGTLQLAIDPLWFLAAFMLLMLVYRGAVTEQVPLYLTNAATADVLGDVLAAEQVRRPALRVLDIGAGLGSTLRPLARRFPECRFAGVENAPLTWALGWLLTRGRRNLGWHWGDLWQIDLGEFDVVYAFLSPAPMPALWEKVQAEMKPGSLFVSNSFAVPEVEPSETLEAPGSPPRRLYCYRR